MKPTNSPRPAVAVTPIAGVWRIKSIKLRLYFTRLSILVFILEVPISALALPMDCLVRSTDEKPFEGQIDSTREGYLLTRTSGPTLFFKKGQTKLVLFGRSCSNLTETRPITLAGPKYPELKPPVLKLEPRPSPFHGEPVSLNFDHANLIDIFHVLAETAHLNLIVSPNIQGEISLRLHDVPWDQILDILARIFHFGYQIEGTILSIFPLDP